MAILIELICCPVQRSRCSLLKPGINDQFWIRCASKEWQGWTVASLGQARCPLLRRSIEVGRDVGADKRRLILPCGQRGIILEEKWIEHRWEFQEAGVMEGFVASHAGSTVLRQHFGRRGHVGLYPCSSCPCLVQFAGEV